MDVYNMYLGDCSSYSPRGNTYRDYEKFPYGSLERVSNPQKSYYTMVQEKLQRAKTSKKESCPFCQEQKKRPLIAYMRKRAQEKNGKICEEEPDEEEEAQAHAQHQHQQQQHRQHCHGDHHQQHSAAGNSSTCGKENAKTRK